MKHNDPVVTPDGEGVYAGASPDRKRLLCSYKIPLKEPKKFKDEFGKVITITHCIAFKFYPVEQVKEREDVV